MRPNLVWDTAERKALRLAEFTYYARNGAPVMFQYELYLKLQERRKNDR